MSGTGQIVDEIISFETGELEPIEVIKLFSELIKSGMAWSLQGSYGRAAKHFIDEGYLSKDGEMLTTLQCASCGVLLNPNSEDMTNTHCNHCGEEAK